MKRLMICFVLLSSLNSCKMTQPEYYDAGYFHSVPPRSEIYGFDEHPHDYRNPKHGHRPAVKKQILILKLHKHRNNPDLRECDSL